MKNLYMQEEAVEISEDKDGEERRLLIYDSGVFESRFTTSSEVFKNSRREHGRCVSKVYVDTKDGKARQIGWVFQKRVKYTDSKETYLQETWITVHNAPPVITKKYNPVYLD